jgi:hypothetical protein
MSSNGQADPGTRADRRRRLLVIGIIVLALLVFGGGYALGRGNGQASASPAITPPVATDSPGPTAEPSPTRSHSGSESESETASAPATVEPDVLGDGRYFVQLTDVQGGEEGPLQLQYDLAYFLQGDEANQAAADRALETPVPNDYLIVNDSHKLRLTPLSGTYGVKYLPEGTCCQLVKAHESQFLGWMGETQQSDFPQKDTSWWWITIEGGEVAKIAQQYLP